MKELSKRFAKGVADILDKTLRIDANSASCIIYYQPKAPKELDKYRRIK